MSQLDQALDYIFNGDTIAIDSIKVTIDQTKERIMLASSSLAMPALISENAKSY